MAVIELVQFSNKDTVEALKYLLYQAEHGHRVSFAGVFRIDQEIEEGLFTGGYKAHPDQAISAALRLTLAMQPSDGLDRSA
jgi:hypothetical protein